MKISKIFAVMSAAALAAATLSAVSVSAAEEKENNKFYPADGTTSGVYTYTYTGDQIAAAVDGGGAQLNENKDPEGGPSTWTCGFNIQVGHQTNALVTMKVTSSKANIYTGDAENPGSEDYLYTVQTSWNGNAPADGVESPVKYNEETTKKGAAELNGWDSGDTKFNGQWAQFMMTDDDLSSVTVEVTIDNSNSTWEYHGYDEEKTADENAYTVLVMFGSPSQIFETVPYEEIFSKDGGSTNSNDSNNSGTGSTASGSSSTASTASTASTSSKSGGSSTSTKSGGTSTSTKTTTSTTTSTSDNTANAESGAAAGVGLAIAALAGAAIVVSRKK